MIDTTTATLTLERFAALRPCWPEYLEGFGGDGMLIARIHPNKNRPSGDENVLARALVFLPWGRPNGGRMARLTIRTTNLCAETGDDDDIPIYREYLQMYRKALQTVLALPVIELAGLR